MNLFAPQHLIPILIILLLLFGRGKISDFMGDFAKGIKSFKKGLKDDDETSEENVSSSARGAIGTHNEERPHSAVHSHNPAKEGVHSSSDKS